MKFDPAQLYRTETNQGYTWEPAEPDAGLRAACETFGVPGASVEELRKPNPFSSIYRTSGVILRAVAETEAAMTEQQASILVTIPYEGTIKPLRASDATYTIVLEGRAWMAYPELPGELFAGGTPSAERAVREAVRFLEVLAEAEPNLATAALPVVPHRPGAWSSLVERLQALGPAPDFSSLLAANASEIEALAEELAELPVSPTLVHNDMNHSNTLVSGGRIWFLDAEDLRFEDRRIAAAHAAFKLLRHAVYSGAEVRESVRDETVPAVMSDLARVGLEGRSAIRDYGAFRIVSDLHEIAAYTEETGDRSQLYDLDKRISNLFELYDLLP